MYYSTARCTKSFDSFHLRQQLSFNSSSIVKRNGLSIWTPMLWTAKNRNWLKDLIEKGLRRREKEDKENDGEILIDHGEHIHSLFTVLQCRHGVSPKFYHSNFYPIFISYLNRSIKHTSLAKLLNHLSDSTTFASIQ